MLELGIKAPDFELPDQNGEMHKLSDYKVFDPKYNKYNFRIHDYFLAKALDQVRPGGMVAVITTKGTQKQRIDVDSVASCVVSCCPDGCLYEPVTGNQGNASEKSVHGAVRRHDWPVGRISDHADGWVWMCEASILRSDGVGRHVLVAAQRAHPRARVLERRRRRGPRAARRQLGRDAADRRDVRAAHPGVLAGRQTVAAQRFA